MRAVSIKTRLAAWYSAVLLFSLVLFGFGMWFALERHLIAGIDERLSRQAVGMEAALESERSPDPIIQIHEEIVEFASGLPPGAQIQARIASNRILVAPPGSATLAFRNSAPGPQFRIEVADARRFRVFTKPIAWRPQRFDLTIAIPFEEVEGILRDFRSLLMLMIPGVLLISGLGGWWISRRALQPVDQITNDARSITLQNLSKRLSVPTTGDELQRMAQTWNEVLARLEAAVERTRRFTEDASHELRTPVALIRATAEVALRRERTAEEYRQALAQVQRDAEHMTRLAENLLYLAGVDANPLEMPLSPVDLNTMIAAAAEKNMTLAQSKGIRLSAAPAPVPAVAPVNEPGMRRLLQILIDNALKFTYSGGCVEVSAAVARACVVVAVADTGKGIPEEAIPHIFERFYRADRETEGAGLGLSIAQMIAQAHGSTVQVETKQGEGSRFYVKINL
jgi:two-component system, OmpR family, heavy metal sensor histidine kinase CusS